MKLSLFEFTSAERRGLVVLSLLILILLVSKFFIQKIPPKNDLIFSEKTYNNYLAFEERQAFLSDSLQKAREFKSKIHNKNYYNYGQKKGYNSNNYHRYNQNEEKFESNFTDTINKSRRFRNSIKKTNLSAPKIDLNIADTFELQRVPGIGSKIAESIVKYRKRLGGFVCLEQLLEIYLIDSVKYKQINMYLIVNDNHEIEKININEASVSELRRHPYIDYYLAKSIVAARKNKGKYKSLEEMRVATHVYHDLYVKIAPYLDIK